MSPCRMHSAMLTRQRAHSFNSAQPHKRNVLRCAGDQIRCVTRRLYSISWISWSSKISFPGFVCFRFYWDAYCSRVCFSLPHTRISEPSDLNLIDQIYCTYTLTIIFNVWSITPPHPPLRASITMGYKRAKIYVEERRKRAHRESPACGGKYALSCL
jgi:hypothetical protein